MLLIIQVLASPLCVMDHTGSGPTSVCYRSYRFWPHLSVLWIIQVPASPLCVVDSVSKARRVDDVQPEPDPFLLDAHGVFDDAHRLEDPL